MESKYFFFYGGFCSQWYPASFTINQIKYNCCEQYMMSQKALLFDDMKSYKKIMKETDPRKIKLYGRYISDFDEKKWNKHKYKIVYDANYAKFTQNEVLKKKLLATGDTHIVEASPTDKIWGIGFSMTNPNRFKTELWGENLLGKAIMEVRDAIIDNEE